jgi:pSer/pThr/pTyr-binding forkhead associated (FHA) protein
MATILVINGPNQGEWYTLGQRPMVFGRDESLLAEIADPCVSRQHLEIRYDDVQRAFFAIDLRSRNGLLVNGQRVSDWTRLHDDDLIQIGHTLLVFTTATFENADDAEHRVQDCRDLHAEIVDEMSRKAEAYRRKVLHATYSV